MHVCNLALFNRELSFNQSIPSIVSSSTMTFNCYITSFLIKKSTPQNLSLPWCEYFFCYCQTMYNLLCQAIDHAINEFQQ